MNPPEKTRPRAATRPASTGAPNLLDDCPSAPALADPPDRTAIQEVSRNAMRNAITAAASAPARATTNQRSGCALPNSAKIVVKMTGSGFHVGPPVVVSLRWTISRPQISHDHGS